MTNQKGTRQTRWSNHKMSPSRRSYTVRALERLRTRKTSKGQTYLKHSGDMNRQGKRTRLAIEISRAVRSNNPTTMSPQMSTNIRSLTYESSTCATPNTPTTRTTNLEITDEHLLHLRPEGLWGIHSAGGTALLSLILECASDGVMNHALPIR